MIRSMRGKLTAGVGLAGVVLLAALLPTSAPARGGNHGCDVATGVAYSDHFWPEGDKVIVTSYTKPEEFPNPAQEYLRAENPGQSGSGNSVTCAADPGTWQRFTSDLGPGDDSVRLDAVGIQGKVAGPPRPLLRRILAVLNGDGGADRMIGHAGVDKMRGGPGGDNLNPGLGQDVAKGEAGPDVIRAADRKRDRVLCGPGRDKAFVDSKDRVVGCERIVRR